MHGRRPAHTAAIAMLLVGWAGPGVCAAAENRGIVRGAERPAGAGPTVLAFGMPDRPLADALVRHGWRVEELALAAQGVRVVA